MLMIGVWTCRVKIHDGGRGYRVYMNVIVCPWKDGLEVRRAVEKIIRDGWRVGSRVQV